LLLLSYWQVASRSQSKVFTVISTVMTGLVPTSVLIQN